MLDDGIMKLNEGKMGLSDRQVFVVSRVYNHRHGWLRGIAASRQVVRELGSHLGINKWIDNGRPKGQFHTLRLINVLPYVRLNYFGKRRETVQTVEVERWRSL